MLIGVLNRKGGCGKSTTAVHLAYWFAQQRKRVLVIDADGQLSASQWLEQLKLPTIVATDSKELWTQMRQNQEKYEAVIVDSPATLNETTKVVLLGVDLALIPVQPSNLDLAATKEVVRLVQQVRQLRKGSPTATLFLSRATKGTLLLKESQESLAKIQDLQLLKTVIYQRQVIADAPGQLATVFNLAGEAALQASKEYEQLFAELWELLQPINDQNR